MLLALYIYMDILYSAQRKWVHPLWKVKHFKQYLNEHKNIFQNVDKTKFYISSV